MRTAIVHYWLLGMRGGERVVESLCRMLPGADIFTLFYDPERVSDTIRSHRVTASYLNPARRWYRSLLPLMPAALESLDLRPYDLVITSESGPAKGVLTRSDARNVCYCHTPMRYLWELYPEYLARWSGGALRRLAFRATAPRLRAWDLNTAALVDQFVANSENVRRRIWKTYRREAEVVYPPVAVESFRYEEPEDYYLVVSELVPYKQVDRAVRVFSRSGRRLRIVGDGPEYRNLKQLGGGNVEFCGRVSDEELREIYARSTALLMPGEEDFGMTAVEALSSGKPVIALARGGVLESFPPEPAKGGVLYEDDSDAALEHAVRRFESMAHEVVPAELQRWALGFSEPVFHYRMSEILGVEARTGVPA